MRNAADATHALEGIRPKALEVLLTFMVRAAQASPEQPDSQKYWARARAGRPFFVRVG